MKHVHFSYNLSKKDNLDFLYETNYVKRAGIIPYMIYNGVTYVLLGYSKESNPVWADLGGRAEKGETTLDTALREFGEESRYVLSIDLNKVSKILISGNRSSVQVHLIIEVSPTPYNININDAFQKTVPKTQYEDEMSFLQWIPYDTFMSMNGLSKSMQQFRSLLSLIETHV